MTKDLAQYLMNIQVQYLFFTSWSQYGILHVIMGRVFDDIADHIVTISGQFLQNHIKKNCCVLKHCWNKYRKHIFISAYMYFNKCSFTFVLFPTFSMNRFLRHVTTLPWSSSSFFWVCRTFLQNLGMSNRHFFWSSGFNL